MGIAGILEGRHDAGRRRAAPLAAATVTVVAAEDDFALATGAAAVLCFGALERELALVLAPRPEAATFFFASTAAATLAAKPVRIPAAALPLRNTLACGDIGIRP